MNCNISECKAKCCGPVPMDKDIFNKNKHLINKSAHITHLENNILCFDPKSLACGFLDDDKKCKIYEDRPEICRLFGDRKHNIPILKCQYLGQIGTMEQENLMDNTISRLKKAVNNAD